MQNDTNIHIHHNLPLMHHQHIQFYTQDMCLVSFEALSAQQLKGHFWQEKLGGMSRMVFLKKDSEVPETIEFLSNL